MSESPSSPGPAAARRWVPLEPPLRRVLGVLIEKAKTTPAGYPMSVNALVAGCNQKNNRDPITVYDDTDVENALRDLEKLGVVREVDWMGRVPKYKHDAYEWLGVSKAELAVLTELLLRGAQAIGDLRARAARMEPIADLGELKPIVQALTERGLMIELTPPGRGQIVSHHLYPARELVEVRERWRGGGAVSSGHESPAPTREPAIAGGEAPSARPSDASGELRAEVVALREEVARLRERLDAIETRLGDPPAEG